jgi:hypothetical protein
MIAGGWGMAPSSRATGEVALPFISQANPNNARVLFLRRFDGATILSRPQSAQEPAVGGGLGRTGAPHAKLLNSRETFPFYSIE